MSASFGTTTRSFHRSESSVLSSLAALTVVAAPIVYSFLRSTTTSTAKEDTTSHNNISTKNHNNHVEERHNTKDDTTHDDTSSHDDAYYLAKAHQLRENLTKPLQSRFRVVCFLLVSVGDNNNKDLQLVIGVNDEPTASINGAICAERAALLQLRWQFCRKQQPRIRCVYIVTDANVPLPPGLLCREYLYGHPAVCPETTLVLLQSCNAASNVWQTRLSDLYPHPGIYSGKSVEAQVELGQQYGLVVRDDAVDMDKKDNNEDVTTATSEEKEWGFVEQQQEGRNNDDNDNAAMENWASPGATTTRFAKLWEARVTEEGDNNNCSISLDLAQQVWKAALKATRGDFRDDVHAIRYGAAAAIVVVNGNNNEPPRIVSAHQKKALEYGASQDAVCQLLAHVPMAAEHRTATDENDVRLLMQVDQFGIPHAPYAAARSLWMEHGHGRTQCLISTTTQVSSLSFQKKGNNNDNDTQLSFQLVPISALAPFVPEFRA